MIRGNHLEITEALREYVKRKLSRIEKYFDQTDGTVCNVLMSVTRGEHKVEVTIPLPKLILRAEESSEDMYASIDLVVEKLERQIRKYKTRVNRRPRQDASFRAHWKEVNGSGHADMIMTNGEAEVEENDLKIVRTKRFQLKPMDTEEAILQMDLLGHNFFVFTNAATDQVNVVYRRNDGKYGLIEPE